MRRDVFSAAAASLLLLATSVAAAADSLVLRAAPVATSTALVRGQMIEVAARPDGRYLVVWPATGIVVGAVFAADGTPIVGARSLTGASRGANAGRPRAAALADGRFVVAWVEEHGPAQLFVRLVDADGKPLGSPVLVGSANLSPQGLGSTTAAPDLPSLAADERGVVTIAWSSVARVRLRRFQVSGADLQPLSWPAYPGTEALDLGSGADPAVEAVPGGRAIAYATFRGVTVLMLDHDGRQRGETVELPTLQPPGFAYTNSVTWLRLAADESGRFLVVWREYGDQWGETGLVERSELLRAQRFAANGTPVGDVLELVTGPSDPADPFREMELGGADARPDGTWLLTWGVGRHGEICGGPADGSPLSCYRENYEGDVYARVFAADGTPLGDAVVAAGDPTQLPGGAAATENGWVIAHLDPDTGALDAERVALAACGDAAGALCLGDRFRLEVEWRTDAAAGHGRPLGMSTDTGAFWFFSPSNVEVVAKVLDGTGVNGKHWVFFASLTDVEFDLVVTDTTTGAVKRYHNPQGTLASRADTEAFGGGTSVAAAGSTSAALGAATVRAPAPGAATESLTGACPAGALCLADGRFVVIAKWRLDGTEGAATPIAWTGETGTFWFFSRSNVELAVKVLDGRGVNSRFWVFYASLSDVDFDLEVLDTTTGQRRTYHNPKGTLASRADVEAF